MLEKIAALCYSLTMLRKERNEALSDVSDSAYSGSWIHTHKICCSAILRLKVHHFSLCVTS